MAYGYIGASYAFLSFLTYHLTNRKSALSWVGILNSSLFSKIGFRNLIIELFPVYYLLHDCGWNCPPWSISSLQFYPLSNICLADCTAPWITWLETCCFFSVSSKQSQLCFILSCGSWVRAIGINLNRCLPI